MAQEHVERARLWRTRRETGWVGRLNELVEGLHWRQNDLRVLTKIAQPLRPRSANLCLA